MRIDVYHHIVSDNAVLSRLDAMTTQLDRIEQRQEIIMSLETEALDKLEASTALINGAEESAEASFLRLAEMIAALKTNTTDPATAARITAVSDALAARAERLGVAVANTPQA